MDTPQPPRPTFLERLFWRVLIWSGSRVFNYTHAWGDGENAGENITAIAFSDREDFFDAVDKPNQTL
jgi:hypothetical protein